jgi:VWFA-related protein
MKTEPVTTTLAFGLLLLLQSDPAVRSVSFAAVDEKGAPVQGLTRDEVVVLENGVAREPTGLEPDPRPLRVALIVDTSRPVATQLRLHVVDAVAAFVQRLPEGTQYAVWTTGDRPQKTVDYTTDRPAAARQLKRTLLDGGNTLLDAVVEATQDMKSWLSRTEQEEIRPAVVVVSGAGIGFASYDRRQVVDRVAPTGILFSGVVFDEGGGPLGGPGSDPQTVGRLDYEYVVSTLAERSGGLFESTLSAMGVDDALDKIAADLAGRYRVSYATLSGSKADKVEVTVARPGVKVRVAPSPSKP